MKGSGTLTIQACSAQLTRDTEFLGKMDPFCEIKIGNQEQKTKVHNNAGKFPQWNDSFSFKVAFEDIIQFLVWDKDTVSKNDLIGEGSAALCKYKVSEKQSDYILISYKGKSAGKVLIETQWFPDHKDQPQPQQQQQQQQAPIIIMGGGGMQGMGSQYQPPYQQQPYYPPPPQNLYQSSPGYQQQPPAPMYGSYAPSMGGYQQQPPAPMMQSYTPPQGGYQQPMGYQQQPYQQPPYGQSMYQQQGAQGAYGQQPPSPYPPYPQY